MKIGFADKTKKGHLTSQLCFFSLLFTQYSDKKNLVISRNPKRAEHYLGLSLEETEKKRNDLFRLTVNGQLTTQLLKDYSIPIIKGLDYLDASFVDNKEKEYQKALYEYLLEKADEGYAYVFADMDFEMGIDIDKMVLCLPQSEITIKQHFQEDVRNLKSNRPLIIFGSYFPESRWTKQKLAKRLNFSDLIATEFSYELFDAYQSGKLIDYFHRKALLWEKEYKKFAKYIG